MPDDVRVVVIGAGQAGLAVSHELVALGVDHVVLERARVGQTWRGRWDSFCLVTPNWTMSLPGAPYAGADPDGFAPREEIVRYLEAYAASGGLPVREGVGVDSLEPAPDGQFLLRTSQGDIRAESVVVCTGAYQRPHRPSGATSSRPGCWTSPSRTTETRMSCRPDRCWWSAAGRPAARSPRSCANRAERCSSPAGGRRGHRSDRTAVTWSPGWSRRRSSTSR